MIQLHYQDRQRKKKQSTSNLQPQYNKTHGGRGTVSCSRAAIANSLTTENLRLPAEDEITNIYGKEQGLSNIRQKPPI